MYPSRPHLLMRWAKRMGRKSLVRLWRTIHRSMKRRRDCRSDCSFPSEPKIRAENSGRRSSTLLLPNATNKAFTCILTTTCPKANGAALSPMAMAGSVTLISVLPTGRAGCRIWSPTYALLPTQIFLQANVPNLHRHHPGPISFPSACVTNCDLHLTMSSSLQSHTTGQAGTRICAWVPTL